MAFELETGESVGAGVRRIVDEQLAKALDELRAASGSAQADEAVHAARKRLKRVRAVARLVRGELGEAVFARENAAFRDAGGSLSEARDAAVLVQTLDTLKPRVDSAAAFAAARKKLVARRRAVSQRVLEQGEGLAGTARAIDDVRQRVAEWQVERDDWRAVRPGLRRIYTHGRRAMKLAGGGADAEVFHEWRKQVKNLWHQLEVIEPVWPEVIKALAEESHRLADALGKEHDLAVLRDVLEADALARADAQSSVLDAVEVARAEFQRDALALGARIFAEKPKAFVKRLGKYWKAWKAGAAAEPREESTVDLNASPVAVAAAEVREDPVHVPSESTGNDRPEGNGEAAPATTGSVGGGATDGAS